MKVTQKNFDYDENNNLLLNGKPCDVCPSCKGIGFIDDLNGEDLSAWCDECHVFIPDGEPPEELPEYWNVG